ncbi:MAG: hypothetical protein Q9163_006093 [Psora crenata]
MLAAYKGQWTDIDLTGSLEPPRDLFVDVRVLKDAGEIQTEYGIRSQDLMPSIHDLGYQGIAQDIADGSNGANRRPTDSSSPRRSFSSSLNQKTPARSFFHRSFHDAHAPIDIVPNNTALGVREETAELASWALSDANRNGHSPSWHHPSSTSNHIGLSGTPHVEHGDAPPPQSDDSARPHPIAEVSEPSTGHSASSSLKSRTKSALTEMIRSSPPSEYLSPGRGDEETFSGDGHHAVTVGPGIIHQPTERTSLLLNKSHQWDRASAYHSARDPENQKAIPRNPRYSQRTRSGQLTANLRSFAWTLTHLKSWDKEQLWREGICRPLSFIPPVILGLLLNVLDALSYGMILFPLSQPIFANLGPDGISIFYVSCIVSQLVYSCGGSIFKGGIGSEMIEVVPFFHKMAFTILNRVGEDNPKSVLATTILSYSLSAIMTGVVFFLMGLCGLGTLIGFFPRHILIGCIGGVGLFLVATGLEVSGRLENSFAYNVVTLKELFQNDRVALWAIPLGLAILLLLVKRWIKHPLTDATYFISIIAVFYFIETVSSNLTLEKLRSTGWVFETPEAGVPFYHFYTLYDFGAVDWKALGSTVPAMLALTFFGVLHVPINIPALGLTMGEDHVDVDRELRAHGVSNVLSGACGSIQNYLVYTNSVLFVRGGGDSRLAGVMLAIATCGILVVGTSIIGFIPVMVVGALIFFLGIDLMREALWQTWGKVHRLEYLTIVIIVVTMGVWDFVIGILVGIVLACVSFVLQTSQVSAIRATLYGGVASSTVRRHPIQQRFLRDAGKQIHVMKMAGFLFFGTIVDVEKQIRALLDDAFQQQPIRFLVLDLFNVDGVDFSAAEAFTRINRILNAKSVQLVICGLTLDGEVGRSLRNVGLFDEGESVQYFLSLNAALEYCENELLKAFYNAKDGEREIGSRPTFLEVPEPVPNKLSISNNAISSSPRQNHLHQVATMTLSEQDPARPATWQDYGQPLRLILQTFSTVSDKPDEFWFPTVSCFVREDFSAGAVLYSAGEPSTGFYLLESGMLKALYDLPQGKYSELIVAGTTCGELPFFSSTPRTATTRAERDSVTWILTEEKWVEMQEKKPAIAQELLKISLKFTSERMDAVTKASMSIADSDPFVDPTHAVEWSTYVEDTTLAVGRNASLTLATDSLIVFGVSFEVDKIPNNAAEAKTTQVIPFFNVLWAELSDFDITVQFARPASKNHVRVASIRYLVEEPQKSYATSWVSKLLDRAYGQSQRRKRIKVLINPFGGKGSAQKWFLRDIEPIFSAARCEMDVEMTSYQGHATEIAKELNTDAYDVVASCSGDGLPHEVFNGLGQKPDAVAALSKVAVVQLPCGTGNAMSLNLHGTDSTSIAALCVVKGIRTPLDLTSITQGRNRTLSFLSQSVGMVAEADLGTEHLRWMGSARFTYGFLVRVLQKTVYPCDLAVKIDIPTKARIKDHYRQEISRERTMSSRGGPGSLIATGLPPLAHGTINSPLPQSFTPMPAHKIGNFYAGNMALIAPGTNFFPATLPSDGYLDLVTIDGDISRIAIIKTFLAVENGNFFDMPHVGYRKISGYRITPLGKDGGYISIDGERVPFEAFQAEVHKGLGCTLSKSGKAYEVAGVVPLGTMAS